MILSMIGNLASSVAVTGAAFILAGVGVSLAFALIDIAYAYIIGKPHAERVRISRFRAARKESP